MEVKNLTTGDNDPQVNSEIQDEVNTADVTVDETKDESTNVDESISNEQAQEEAYADAWDNVNLDDESIFNKPSVETNDTPDPVDTPDQDVLSTTQDTNNNIGAFMIDKPVLKFKGREIPVDSEDELINLAQKGLQMETAAAEMKPKKKALKIIDGIPLEVLQAIADIHGGNTNAIGYIKKQYGIEDTRSVAKDEADDIWADPKEEPATPVKTEDSTYSPSVEQDDPLSDYWNEFAQSKPTVAAKVNEVYSSLDDSFKAEVYTEDMFKYFVSSVESGEFEKIYPIAIKEKSLNPAITWIQAVQLGLSKVGQPPVVQSEPPASATPPTNTNTPDRNMGGGNGDRVWEDDAYFKELEDKLFG